MVIFIFLKNMNFPVFIIIVIALLLQNGARCATCPAVLNCNQCDIDNICSVCSANFFFLPSGSIGCCATGFTWSLTVSICVQCTSNLNCNRCDAPNICADCNSGYNFLPADSTSIGCCASGQTWSSLSGNGCVSCTSNLQCSRCDTANICKTCNTNRYINPAGSPGCCAID